MTAAEIAAALAGRFDIEDEVDRLLDLAGLDPDILKTLGADQLTLSPLRVVGGTSR